MTTIEGQTVRRRRLRSELRRVRETASLTQDQVATAMDWSLSKVIRIENGAVGISTNDLKALLDLYGVTERRRVDDLVGLAQSARQRARAWWSAYRSVISPQYLTYLGYEAEASAIRQFHAAVVPALSQTEAYARDPAGHAADADEAGRGRDARQDPVEPPTPCARAADAAGDRHRARRVRPAPRDRQAPRDARSAAPSPTAGQTAQLRHTRTAVHGRSQPRDQRSVRHPGVPRRPGARCGVARWRTQRGVPARKRGRGHQVPRYLLAAAGELPEPSRLGRPHPPDRRHNVSRHNVSRAAGRRAVERPPQSPRPAVPPGWLKPAQPTQPTQPVCLARCRARTSLKKRTWSWQRKRKTSRPRWLIHSSYARLCQTTAARTPNPTIAMAATMLTVNARAITDTANAVVAIALSRPATSPIGAQGARPTLTSSTSATGNVRPGRNRKRCVRWTSQSWYRVGPTFDGSRAPSDVASRAAG